MFKTNVIDVRNNPHYRPYSSILNQTPWVVMITDATGDYPFIHGRSSLCGYATKADAKEAAKGITADKHDGFIVMKNTDFTEGRGPMRPHAFYRRHHNAHNFVMRQQGIYGSAQYCNVRFGLNVYGDTYGSRNYNGYDIIPFNFED